MNHPDWPAFLNAIIADPEENTPRLVAADFLDENGKPDRAEFIRVQIALANLVTSRLGSSREAEALHRREIAYIDMRSKFRHLWAAEECPELVRVLASGLPDPLADLHVEGADQFVWRRGFVERVYCPAVEWFRCGIAMRARNPIREIALVTEPTLGRDVWANALPTLKGVPVLCLYRTNRDSGDPFAKWLTESLPGTQIEIK